MRQKNTPLSPYILLYRSLLTEPFPLHQGMAAAHDNFNVAAVSQLRLHNFLSFISCVFGFKNQLQDYATLIY